ncbi:hypothetical protein M513_04260 [Trichuris suis]|uniref:pseudouridine 5'-phosphatase n=2 Tax=Trichuris suis TaxID=68888 RepID=A0A085MC80_9BILA|nr:hypothetical protein M513_04260 [Trichuris suis]
MMALFHPVTHVIFDMDGLLINTEDHYTEAHNMLLKRFGKTFTWDLKAQQMGRSERDGFQLVIDQMQLPVTLDDMIAEMTTYMEQLFPNAVLMPGAERLVVHLSKHNVPIALCSGSKAHFYEMKTAKHKQVFDLFHHRVLTPDDPDVTHGKPHPECYLTCAKRFQPPPTSPSSVLVFEDSPNGVQAALNAGMQVVLVPDPRLDKRYRDYPTLCIDSLLDFKPEMFGLPSFTESH